MNIGASCLRLGVVRINGLERNSVRGKDEHFCRSLLPMSMPVTVPVAFSIGLSRLRGMVVGDTHEERTSERGATS